MRGILVVLVAASLWPGAPAWADGDDLPPPVVIDPASGRTLSGSRPTPPPTAPAPLAVPVARPRPAPLPRPVPPPRPLAVTEAVRPLAPTASVRAAGAVARRPRRDPFQVPRGPLEIRDQYLLAQPRLTMPATSPDPNGRGRWVLVLRHDWGNDFGFSQVGPAEDPFSDVRFQVDGEHRTFDLGLSYGVASTLDFGVRIPVQWRGGGYLDGLIDWWHERWGLGDNARSDFKTDQYRVRGRDAQLNRYSWDEDGWGLGNVELNGRWAFLRPTSRSGLRAAVVGRVTLPTATGPFETNSVDAGLQLTSAIQLWRRFDVYGGVAASWYSEESIQGILYEPWRGYAFLAVEWRVFPTVSLLVQTDASTNMITNLVDFPETQWYLQVGAKFDLGPSARLTGGLTENLESQQSTVDVGIFGSLEFFF